MMGFFLSRACLMFLGYAYPAYECFKAVEKKKPEIEQLLFWCQYWILAATLTVCERVGDNLISWLPMYSEAKLALFIYLWHPKTKGTDYVYNFLFRPYVAKHETEIDRNLLELSVKAREIGLFFWQEASGYGQTRFFEILQYVSSRQSATGALHSDKLKKQHEHEILSQTDQAATEDNSLRTTMPMPVEEATSLQNENLNFSKQEITISEEAATPQTRRKWRIFRASAAN